jgi:hypothetical protein
VVRGSPPASAPTLPRQDSFSLTHLASEREPGHPGDKESRDGSGRCGLPGALSDPRSGGKFPTLMDEILAEAGIKTVHERYPDAAHELDDGAVGAVVSPRAFRPLPAAERTPPAARHARVRTVLQPAPNPPSPGPSGPTTHRPRSDQGFRAVRGCGLGQSWICSATFTQNAATASSP